MYNWTPQSSSSSSSSPWQKVDEPKPSIEPIEWNPPPQAQQWYESKERQQPIAIEEEDLGVKPMDTGE